MTVKINFHAFDMMLIAQFHKAIFDKSLEMRLAIVATLGPVGKTQMGYWTKWA